MLFSLKVASEKTGVPVRTLRSAAESGKIPHTRVGRKNSIYVNVQHVEEALKDGRIKK
jgi:excisionase family DNA binding protein